MGELYLIRHGQASFDAEDYDCLSPLGHQQAQHSAAHLLNRDLLFDAVYSGSLQRQIDTAQAYCDLVAERSGTRKTSKRNSPTLTCAQHEGFNEFPAEKIIRYYLPKVLSEDEALAELFQQPGGFKKKFSRFFWPVMDQWFAQEEALPEIETWPDFRARVRAALDELMTRHEGERVGVFTSGGTISTILQTALELNDRKTFELNLRIANASITRLQWRGQSLHLSYFNQYEHLDSSLITYK